MTGLITQYAFIYTDENRLKLNNFREMMELADYLEKQGLVERFADFANGKGLARRNLMIKKSYHLLDTYINSRIIYNILDENAWMQYLNIDDKVIKAALQHFDEKK
jgi:carboxyl-terminal processing protease